MNPSKKDYSNAWILCESKRFPGFSYHYNAITREAVWNINDMERRQHMNYVQDKWQYYPEPECPPVGPSVNPWQSYQPNRSFCQPVFGQMSFQKLAPIPESDWSPMPSSSFSNRPMSMPIYEQQFWSGMGPNFGPKQYQFGPMKRENGFPDCKFFDPRMPMSDQQAFTNHYNQKNARLNSNQYLYNKRSMPYTEPQMFNKPSFTKYRMPCNDNIFPAGMATSNFTKSEEMRKQNYQNPFSMKTSAHKCKCMLSQQNTQKLNHQIEMENLDFVSKKIQSTSLDSIVSLPSECNEIVNQPITKEAIFSQPKLPNANSYKNLANERVRRYLNLPIKPTETSNSLLKEKQLTVKTNNSVKLISDCEQTVGGDVENESTDMRLQKTDLRHILLSRRRKSSTEDATTHGKRIKTSYPTPENKEDLPKKQVTFDLGVEEYSVDGDGLNCDDQETKEPVGTQEMDLSPILGDEESPCYIVVDTDVLLTQFPLMEEFVQSDETYTLLIPQVVKREVASLAVGLCNGRTLVLNARQILRKLADPPSYITVQLIDSQEQSCELTEDLILKCCMQIFEDGHSVLLVTDNEELYNKAVALELCCYTTEDIKEMNVPKPEVSFDCKKIKNVTNNCNNLITKTCINDNNVTSGFPVTCTRKQLFSNTNVVDGNDVFFREQNDLTKKNIDLENLKLQSEKTVLEKKQKEIDFRHYRFQRELAENNKVNSSKNFQQNGEESSNFKDGDETSIFFQNGCQVMEVTSTASKKKIKNVNMYNLNEHLKRFYVNDGKVGERIETRIDEWVCSFSQIMEFTLMDTLKNLSEGKAQIAFGAPRPPIRELLESVRGICSEHRTVTTLADRLCAALDCGYRACRQQGRLTLCMKPNEMMKMLGYGMLLIKCLRDIYPNYKELEEGEALLEQLLSDIENVNAEIEPPTSTPMCRGKIVGETVNRTISNFVKQPSEVLQYIKKHFKNCNSHKTAEDEEKHEQVQENSASQVVQTCDKEKEMVKLNNNKTVTKTQKEKPIGNSKETKIMAKNYESEVSNAKKNIKRTTGPKLMRNQVSESSNFHKKIKEIDIERRENLKIIPKNFEINALDAKNMKVTTRPKLIRKLVRESSKMSKKMKEIETGRIDNLNITPEKFETKALDEKKNIKITTGPKLIRKLVLESTNLPPKMKEIDIEKRETVNKQMLDMIDSMVGNNNDKENKDVNAEITKEITNNKPEPKIVRTVKNITLESSPKKDNSQKIEQCKTAIIRTHFDLDALDYSDATEDTFVLENKESIIPNDTQNSNMSPQSNVSQNNNEINDISQTSQENNTIHDNNKNHDNTQNNMLQSNEHNDNLPDMLDNVSHDELDNISHDGLENVSHDELINDDPSHNEQIADTINTVDSGFHEGSVYAFVKMFLVEVTKTFKDVRKYIHSTLCEIKKEMNDQRREQLYESVMKIHEHIVYLVDSLKRLKERDATEPLSPSLALACDAAANDLRMQNYSQIISRLLLQSHLLKGSLMLLSKMIRGALDDLSSTQSCNNSDEPQILQ